MKFGQKLQQLRKARGWTQEKLAQQLGVSRQAVSKWEVDAAQPDVQNVLQISSLFGVTVDYLLREEESAIPGTKKEPTAPEPFEEPVSQQGKMLRYIWRAAWIFLITGIAGQFILWILSTVIPSEVETTIQRADNFYETIYETVYEFWPFVSTFHLEAVFGCLCFFVLLGGVLLWIWYRKKNHKEILPW